MRIDVVLGLQWGDEGKGKIVDILSGDYELVARFQGGPNAGHTLSFEGKKYVSHTIPSGVFNGKTTNLIGNGVVVDPIALKKELASLRQAGYCPVDKGKLWIAKKAHLILPTHQLLDIASENRMGKAKIGSTLKGIGPAYMDKIGRNGLRIGDILLPAFKERYQRLVEKHQSILIRYGTIPDFAKKEQEFFAAIEFLKKIPQVDGEHFLNQYLNSGKAILAEGAQGTMLDIDFGSYPFVTSSNTTTAGVCTGLGVAPQKIRKVVGVFKAYCTRVGHGPFPTELNDATGELLRQYGHEFGATTGRLRRTGWLDLPALKYAIMLNGVTELVMTKADVLSKLDKIYICTHYQCNQEEIDYMPYDMHHTKPIFQAMAGWQEPLTAITDPQKLPNQLKAFIAYLEQELGLPIKYLSVGPDRRQTLTLS